MSCKTCPVGQIYTPQIAQCSNCPFSTPILVNGQCVSCPTGSNYDSFNQVCVVCSSDMVFNPTTNQCQGFTNPNVTPICSVGAQYNSVLQRCVCPDITPFDNGALCIACPQPYFWNNTVKMCSQCQSGFVYNPSLYVCQRCPSTSPIEVNGMCQPCPVGAAYFADQNLCLGCPSGFYFDLTQQACISSQPISCPSGATYNQFTQLCECPITAPFNNGQQCVACPANQFWNTTNKLCMSCPNGWVYNLATQLCVACQANTPLVINGMCAACPSGTVFNAQSSICVYCGSGSTYDYTLGTCVQSSTAQCPQGATFNFTSQQCQCPMSAPFISGTTCVSCFLPNYWDQNSNVCATCPTGTQYNVSQSRCVACPDGFVFNTATYTCVIYVTTCPIQGQYFNSAMNQCMCIATVPYFDGRQCVACNPPNYWSALISACLTCPNN
jgi:hypothetical protein